MAISFKGAHFPQEVILMGVRWYVAYPLGGPHPQACSALSSLGSLAVWRVDAEPPSRSVSRLRSV